jgi:predicted Zn-dependent peptidase
MGINRKGVHGAKRYAYKMEKIELFKSRKFKNNAISFIIPVDLDEDVTGYNVLAQVLKRGTETFRTSSEITRYLQDMYGSFFDIAISKKGQKLFLIFYCSFLDNRFTLYGEDLWEKAVFLIKDVLYRPLLDGGKFPADIVSQEILNHRLYIESQYDDKGHYSVIKVVEQGLHDSYRKPEFGSIAELDLLDVDALMALWEDLKNKPVYIYASGNIEDEERTRTLLGTIVERSGDVEAVPYVHQAPDINFAIPKVMEPMKINQGKMSLLYSTGTSVFEGDYFALVVMNSIYGGGAHSKLFNEVREKHSLCYYVYSTFDKFKGIMTISSGVDFKNFDRARELIELEMEKMKTGDFTDEEITSSKTKLISSLRSMADSMFNTMDYVSSLRVFGISYGIEDVIRGIEDVTRDRIMESAKNLRFITSHYLTKDEEVEKDA